MSLSDKVTEIKGVGSVAAQRFAKLGIFTLRDLLTFFPRDYEDRSNIVPIFEAQNAEGKVCVRAMLRGMPTATRTSGGRTLVKAFVCDESGGMEVVFFNQPFVKNMLRTGVEYLFFGKVEIFAGKRTMSNPLFEEANKQKKLGSIAALYPSTQGLSQTVIQNAVASALTQASGKYAELLPEKIIEKYRLCTSELAYELIHRPKSWDDVKIARRRLIFEELFMFCLSTQILGGREKSEGFKLSPCDMTEFYKSLPFEPTNAQKRAISDCMADMCHGMRMNRLIQGDVGSGKTLVAAACAYLAVKNGGQAVIMAPTELLAKQHFATLSRFTEPFGITCGCLTSDMSASAKKDTKAKIQSGEMQIICGTHALIQQSVSYKNPYLFVVDEQHRFGVRQRAALSEKAGKAHFMVMSATPIPRTLTLLLYGDLSLSVLNERPAGRKHVLTYCVPESKREGMYKMIRDAAKNGTQTYIVCPLIETCEEDDDRKAAAEYAKLLQKYMPDVKIGLMHGKLKSAEKDAVMADFARGDTSVLVSTTVIEVGTDVPNANIMVVENAESFGLSQLHQLRGRVGRGSEQAYCFLLPRESAADSARFDIMCKTDDGFKIAEEDLKIRGPGDFLGDRQHGSPEFAIANLASDMKILDCAKREAEAIFEGDPTLKEHPALLYRVQELISEKIATMN